MANAPKPRAKTRAKPKPKPKVNIEDIADAVVIEEPEQPVDPKGEEPDVAQADPTDQVPDEVEPAVEEAVSAPETVAPTPEQKPRGGFFPMVLGGAIAAGIGFGAGWMAAPAGDPEAGAAFQADVTARLSGQEKSIAALRSDLAKGLDTSAIDARLGEVSGAVAAVSERLNDIQGGLDTLGGRLTEIEKRPVTESVSPAAIAAYERELKALQDAMAQQREEIEAIAREAQEKEANAAVTAQEAMTRAALSRIQTALDTGNGFAAALADLEAVGQDVPPALKAVAAEGVASMAQLQDAFPEAARAALAAARNAAAKGGSVGIGTFLQTQLGARSLEPKEGNDPDAILSRAEAALQAGRLSDAMVEIGALPEAGRVELTDWMAQATKRQTALAAAEALSQKMISN